MPARSSGLGLRLLWRPLGFSLKKCEFYMHINFPWKFHQNLFTLTITFIVLNVSTEFVLIYRPHPVCVFLCHSPFDRSVSWDSKNSLLKPWVRNCTCIHSKENPIYVFLFWELSGLSPNLTYIHVCGGFIYSQDLSTYCISLQQKRQTNPGNI